MELLAVIRKLSSTDTYDTEDTATQALLAAKFELESLRAAMLRGNEMVSTLVQQRDFYQSLLQETENSSASLSSATSPVKFHRESVHSLQPNVMPNSSTILEVLLLTIFLFIGIVLMYKL